MVTGRSHTQSVHSVLLHLYYMMEKAELYGHKRDQWFPCASRKVLTAKGLTMVYLGGEEGDRTVNYLDCGGG